ncbi:hypothetical protein [Amycolatopsis pithecellobii]|uniref:SnoaL-like domain-containing protein n=1 Tax=Amycolatopsis pithecellobii TaxID=664692 RepID=A0A6N7ZC42_9PSEU|nr:hypothetical protein [Amycolatopsis pithecellobii]MTD59217.1 hypothetical protein [Amycolatopsis pithecellobii]
MCEPHATGRDHRGEETGTVEKLHSDAKITALVQGHIDAENSADLQAIADTLIESVGYRVASPCYPDDPHPFAVSSGEAGYMKVWENLGDRFLSYRAVLNDVLRFPGENRALALYTITAFPARDFLGLPRARAYTYDAAAIMEFDEAGGMSAETVYGNFVMISLGLARMKEFLAEEAGQPARTAEQWDLADHG